MGITTIAAVSNLSSGEIRFWKQDPFHPTDLYPWSERFDLPAGQTRTTVDHKDDPNQTQAMNISIPWCTSREQFGDLQFITVQVDAVPIVYSLWQCRDVDGDFLRFSSDCRYHGTNDGMAGVPAMRVLGYDQVDGRRTMRITADCRLSLLLMA